MQTETENCPCIQVGAVFVCFGGAIIPINENLMAIIPINEGKRPDSACIGRIGGAKRLTALILFQEIFQRGHGLSNLREIIDKGKIERSFISL